MLRARRPGRKKTQAKKTRKQPKKTNNNGRRRGALCLLKKTQTKKTPFSKRPNSYTIKTPATLRGSSFRRRSS